MQHSIIFGLQLNDLVIPYHNSKIVGGNHTMDIHQLLDFLEQRLSLTGHHQNIEHIRKEQYRQALDIYDKSHSEYCFKASFSADPFATATAILGLRDELILAGSHLKVALDTPERIKIIAELERILESAEHNVFLLTGFADRFRKVIDSIDYLVPDFKTIYLNEPLRLLPAYLQELFKAIAKLGVEIKELSQPTIQENHSDLNQLKQCITKGIGHRYTPQGDGSLLILKARRDTELAAWTAKWIKKNPSLHPSCIIPDKNRTLDQALGLEGLPSLGMLSASSARPSLQILKLAPTFLWNPIDPYKIMEFVTLGVKPLADDLAVQIAREMASIPGLRSDSWYAMQNIYFSQLEEKATEDTSIDVAAIQSEYNFWFNRKRYNINKSVPKADVIEIYAYITSWAKAAFEESEQLNTSLIVLSEQANRIVDLLNALPGNMNFLTHLELERIVRTIYESCPVTFEARAVGHLPYITNTSAIISSTPELLWWNFIQNERDYFFSRWYPSELAYLNNNGIKVTTPQDENQLLLWQRTRPILHTQNRLILCIPEMVNGNEVHMHPLYDELHAYLDDLAPITLDITKEIIPSIFEELFDLPRQENIEHQELATQKAFIQLEDQTLGTSNEKESFSSLRELFYYPYQWVFKHKARLQSSAILSIVDERTLMGNLSHRFFELLFENKEDHPINISTAKQADITEWIDNIAPELFAKEGAVLLMYGKEPEKIAFLNKIKNSAWSLVNMIQKDGWSVQATEKGLGGKFESLPIRGKADLVLERGEELAVVDLKWSGFNYRKDLIRNKEDLQLVMYSRLLTESDDWTHTAYFIIESGKMISRNKLAFQDAETVTSSQDYKEVYVEIWDKMRKTYHWRLAQLKEGLIEIRTEDTAEILEEYYHEQADNLDELLEMSNKNAPFDAYQVLINPR